MSRPFLAVAALLAASLGLLAMSAAAQPPDPAAAREKAAKLLSKGDYADALALYQSLLKDGGAEGLVAARDLENALLATDQIGRQELQDDLRELVLKSYPNDPLVIEKAAESLLNGFHYGYVIDGEFTRGQQRRGGNWTNAVEWDRTRALQLLVAGLPHATEEAMGEGDASEYRIALAEALMYGRGGRDAWRLQTLTDLTELPDRADPDPVRETANPAGAPVTEDGTPVYYDVPASWEAAKSDGERWRWALAEAATFGGESAAVVTLERAEFLRSQFGVGTLGGTLSGLLTGDDGQDAGPWALSTLKDTETIAQLATGPKRFTPPEEHNHVLLLKRLGETDLFYAKKALRELTGVYEDRRQYPAAVKTLERLLERLEPGDAEYERTVQRKERIVGGYAAFEPEPVGPVGTAATLSLTYKNAKQATLRAYRVDEWAWFKGAMQELEKATDTDHRDTPSQDLLNQWWGETSKFTSEPIEEWTVELDPPADHTPARKRIETPLKDAGLYFVTAELPNGRTYGVSVQRADLAIVVKPLVGSRALWVVTDAVTGAPVEGVKLDLLGYGYEWIQPPGRRALKVIRRTAVTGPDGTATVPEGNDSQQIYQWLATATKPVEQGEPRFGAFGFSNRTFGAQQIGGPLGTVQIKAYAVSDRPAYRPGDTVNLKGWYRRAGYALPTDAQEPQRRLKVVVNDPRGEELLSELVTADEFGAFTVSLELGEEATLGPYNMQVGEAATFDRTAQSPLNFRVEEYRKPEFEVTVDAPTEPIVLGEEFTATVRAEYLFGGPVAGGVLSYKVTRTVEDAGWHPYDPWDWLYGPAYWSWAPGYQNPGFYGRGYGFGGRGGMGMGGRWNPPGPEEVVAEGEAKLSEDGTYEIPLDSSLAKALRADADHKYAITAEVTDASRRTETGGGSVIAAAVPFRVYGYADYGYAVADEPIGVNFTARTASDEPLRVVGELSAVRLTGGPDGKTVETPLEQTPEPAIDADGVVSAKFLFPEPGQYRVTYEVTDDGHTGTESVVLNVVGANGEAGAATVADGLELIPDRKTYAPGDTAKLLIKTEAEVVYLFLRPEDGTVPEPVLLRPEDGALVYDMPIGDADAPNVWVEALAVSAGRALSVSQRIVVPPTERLLTVQAEPSADRYEPGEEAVVKVSVTDGTGEPVQGDVALTVYDRAIDALVGGPNAPDIRKHFTDLLRSHNVQLVHNLSGVARGLVEQNDHRMPTVGRFGGLVLSDSSGEDEFAVLEGATPYGVWGDTSSRGGGMGGMGGGMVATSGPFQARTAAPAAAPMMDAAFAPEGAAMAKSAAGPGDAADAPAPQVRENFADTAYWTANLSLTNGVGTARFALPDDLTGWQIRTWAVGPGSAVGSADGRFVTKKSLLVRLQTPRFLTETDEIVLSALVRSELEQAVEATVRFDFGEQSPLANPNLGDLSKTVAVPAGKEVRVDLRVSAIAAGEANVTATATTTLPDGTPGPGDAVKQTFPVLEHGTLRTESFAGTVKPGESDAVLNFTVTEQRDPERSRLEVRFSPSLAVAAVDALPYLVHYPYGCAEQTLNRFLPVLTMRHRLEEAGVTLPKPEEVTANLNASRSGRPFREWEEKPNPVFDREQVFEMTQTGVDRLATFARPDGGFGWFPGARSSDPYMTTLVTHGLWLAGQRGADVPQDLIAGGKRYLAQHQAAEVAKLKRGELPEKQREGTDYKLVADSLDAQVFRVLSDLGADPDDETHAAMAGYLFRDRLKLPVKAQALIGLAFAALEDGRLETSLSNLRQYLVVDEESQTAYLRLPNESGWWYWWNNEVETNALYLELLSTVGGVDGEQADGTAPKLVKYLLNNRTHGSRWTSTRDTAHVIEAFAAYLKASGEAAPTADVMITLDGKRLRTVSITPENLFTFDGTALLEGDAVTSGEHVLNVQRATPDGAEPSPVYFTARVTTFDKRPFIPSAGLEIKVTRSVRRITDVDETRAFANDDGNVDEREVDQNAREDLAAAPSAPAEATSGDLIEVELILEAKNDYTYVILSDAKAAGFEPVGSRPGTGPLSGWSWDGLNAYREFRDERTDFFLPNLPRGRHSLRYRLRAEAPGSLHALPAVAEGMYAPELRGNSDEWTAIVVDREDLTP